MVQVINITLIKLLTIITAYKTGMQSCPLIHGQQI